MSDEAPNAGGEVTVTVTVAEAELSIKEVSDRIGALTDQLLAKASKATLGWMLAERVVWGWFGYGSREQIDKRAAQLLAEIGESAKVGRAINSSRRLRAVRERLRAYDQALAEGRRPPPLPGRRRRRRRRRTPS